MNHVKCAAFELPFTGRRGLREGRPGGDPEVSRGGEDLAPGWRPLALDERELPRRRGVASGACPPTTSWCRTSPASPRIIAEVDYDSAPSMVHEKAIYILEGRSYFVEKYDHEERRVHVREADVDYYTDAITYTKVKILDRFDEEAVGNARRNHGEVHVTSQVVGFKKIKFYTNENVGSGELQMPENEMHTTAYWLTVPREVMAALPFTGEERRDGVVALSYTLGHMAALFLMCDRHDLGVALGDNGQGEARIERGLTRLGWKGRDEPAPGAGLRAQRLPLRQLPRRHRPVGAALPAPPAPARREPRAHRGLRVPGRLPLLRRPRGRDRQPRQGSGPRPAAGDPRVSDGGLHDKLRRLKRAPGAPPWRRALEHLEDALLGDDGAGRRPHAEGAPRAPRGGRRARPRSRAARPCGARGDRPGAPRRERSGRVLPHRQRAASRHAPRRRPPVALPHARSRQRRPPDRGARARLLRPREGRVPRHRDDRPRGRDGNRRLPRRDRLRRRGSLRGAAVLHAGLPRGAGAPGRPWPRTSGASSAS